MKLIYFFSFLMFCNLFFSQNSRACELEVLDTVHVSCHQGHNGEVVLFGSEGLEPYVYSLDGNTFQSSGVFNNLSSGNYVFFLRDDDNCIDSIEIKIKEPSNLLADFICDSINNIETLISGGVGPYSVTWRDSINDIFSNSNQIEFMGDNIYYIDIIDNNLCIIKDTIYLKADFDMIAELGIAPFEINTINTSIGATSFLWNTNNENINSINLNYTYNIVGEYSLELTAYNDYGCFDTIIKNINTEGLLIQEEIANVFSPNNDGLNDYFNFLENHALIEFHAIIFNRFGKKIFESKDPSMSWDGTSMNGNVLEEGVYFYILNGLGMTGSEYFRKGFISLFR